MAISGMFGRRPRRGSVGIRYLSWRSNRFYFRLPSLRKTGRIVVACLILLALLPPIFFHFRLRRFHKMKLMKCAWLQDPPFVCAHGGDSANAFPNTMDAYHRAIVSQVDCIEIDVSRSSDGVLFALHDRELQQISGNGSSRVGYLTMKQIKRLDVSQLSSHDLEGSAIPTVENALKLISNSVRQVILDIKVGPPLYEKGLARDILFMIEKLNCKNCVVWAKSDALVRDITKLSTDIAVGYIVMVDPLTGLKSNVLRMKEATVVGVYHPLIDEKLTRILHRRNKKVYAWTVDDTDSMKRMLQERVDAVVTSNPSMLRGLMHDLRFQCTEEGFSFTI